ncbi:hypothetical protein CVT24_007049, partial [Panaeolus cyanescens]
MSRLHIINSYDPLQTNAKGVTIILNKHRTRWKEAKSTEIVPGRAILVTFPAHLQQNVTILAIYAPNDDAQQITLWEQLHEIYETGRSGHNKPDLLLGDFNLVEGRIDRTSRRLDNGASTRRLQDLLLSLNMVDQWREENPGIQEFTYLQKATGAQSRIDRIYVKRDMARHCYQWNNQHSGIASDHKLVSVKIDMPEMPHIGKGRWMIPPVALQYRPLIDNIKRLGETTLTALMVNRQTDQSQLRDEYLPQKAHAALKEKILSLARNHVRKTIPAIQKQINEKELTLKRTLLDLELEPEDRRERHYARAAVLEVELSELYKLTHMTKRSDIQAKFWRDTETISKAWSNINREIHPKETIFRLRKPAADRNAPPTYETRTDAMANLAATYHDGLQEMQEIGATTGEHQGDQSDVITTSLSILDKRLNPEQANYMAGDITEDEIESAIRTLASGKAPGPDGIPLELYRLLLDEAEDDQKAKQHDDEVPHFDLKKYLKIIIDDVACRPPVVSPDTTNFADGWMCPLFKKNDRTDIANYRPITVLNTDYKIMTRALTSRMNRVVGGLIHPDQAGFMTGRHIEDQTDLVQMLTHLCEVKDINGAIICLDQEKAYDKIRHDYLWEVLKAFNFPTKFINMIQNLYANAHTRVMINGVMSNPFQVRRGVRQGDPLSCLLFNLAIEPLAEQLRKSQLKGITINGTERIIASLFADDTTVYLSEDDDIEDLYTLLNEWCRASGAKFNTSKTEIIPLGNEPYRQDMRQWRAMAPQHNPVIPQIRIAKEGEATRVLGAWVGHKIDNDTIWKKKIDEISHVLKRWNRGHPSQEGRRLIISMFVGGKTQYLTRVQGMPAATEHKIEKMIRDFMWDKEGTERYNPPIGLTTLAEDIKRGGRKVLDIKARNEAIDLMRLKTYLKEPNQCPKWTRIADELLSMAASGRQGQRNPLTHINPFLQKWEPNQRRSDILPPILQSMIRSAKKYNVRFAPKEINEDMRRSMPIWHHIGTSANARLPVNGAAARCLMTNHQIKTTGQMESLAKTNWPPHHISSNECECTECMRMEDNQKCNHPHTCATLAKRYINALDEKWKPRANDPTVPAENRNEMDHTGQQGNQHPQTTGTPNHQHPTPHTHTQSTTHNGFRVFTTRHEEPNPPNPANNPAPNPQEAQEGTEPVEVEIAVECINQGSDDAEIRVALWYWNNPTQHNNEVLRMKRCYVTEESGMIVAAAILMRRHNKGPMNVESKRNQLSHVLTVSGPKAEELNMIDHPMKQALRNAITHFRLREGATTLKAGQCNRASRLLKETERPEDSIINYEEISETHHHETNGMQISSSTQSTLYRGAKEFNNERKLKQNEETCHIDGQGNTNRRATKRRLSITRACIAERSNGIKPDDQRIWKSLRNKNITKKIKGFMWLAMHDGQK